MKLEHDLGTVARQFQIAGDFLGAAPWGSGHIHDTYCARFDQAGRPVRYIIQRLNHGIFKNPAALMENVQRVTAHLAQKYAAAPDRARRGLTLIPARDGRGYYCDAQGDYWRGYVFIERTRTYDVIESAAQAFQAAQAFGRFQKLLADLPAPRLHDTIPHFHDPPGRLAALEKAIQADAVSRVARAQAEIEFALQHQAVCQVLAGANLPERVTHNDTKLNNVLLDDATGEGLCVIDLDTVMPGLALYDFGDLVRSATNPAREDERDLSKVTMRFAMFEALARGYWGAAGDFLTPAEKKLLPFGGQLLAYTLGLRFLTDFLAGDTYFKIQRPGQNLDRCRTQFKLMESIGRQEAEMNRLVATL